MAIFIVRKSFNTHGTLSVYLVCRLLTVSCFQNNRFGEIVNSWSQSNSKVQSTLNGVINDATLTIRTLTVSNVMYISLTTERQQT